MSLYVWHISDGFLAESLGEEDSHESVCFTNDTENCARVRFTAYFRDREPTTCNGLQVDAHRNRHIRTDADELRPLALPIAVPYGLRIDSDVALHVQYSRLTQSGPHSTLMTTIIPREDD